MNELLPRDRAETLGTYADNHELFDLFQSIVSRMIIEKPDDVIQFMIEQLQKPNAQGIIIIGPPSAGQDKIAERLALHLDAVLISTGRLLANAIERQSSLGSQARPYLERGEYVPDNIMLGLVTARLQDPEVALRGFVLEGFPRTKEQAKGLISRGFLPARFVILDIPDDTIVSRATETRIDPITNRMYHLTNDPPPQNPAIQSRLIQRSTDTESVVRARLKQYRGHLMGVKSSFDASQFRKITMHKGIAGHENEALREIIREVGRGKITRAPRMLRVVVGGLPGSGKTSVAQMIAKEFGVICISPRLLLLEEISLNTRRGKELSKYIDNADEIPEKQLHAMITQKIRGEECRNNGWVLDGFPRSRAQVDALKEEGITPNRVLLLRAAPTICMKRLSERRYNPLTNEEVSVTDKSAKANGYVDVESKDTSTWPARPQDNVAQVKARIEGATNVLADLEAAYGGSPAAPKSGSRAYPSRAAILQDIDVGAELSRDLGVERMFEKVRDALIRGGNISMERDDEKPITLA
ncbi:adenylate kinase-domain-containing protein [Phlyctochytrium arcticum]|nr:adenylate kinase-domain-containing protein [Phlyctochytrium arcticum]